MFFVFSHLSVCSCYYRKEEQKAHPEEVVNSLKTYARSIKRKSSTTKFMLVATTIRESDELLESDSKDGQEEDSVFTDVEGKTVAVSSDKVSITIPHMPLHFSHRLIYIICIPCMYYSI